MAPCLWPALSADAAALHRRLKARPWAADAASPRGRGGSRTMASVSYFFGILSVLGWAWAAVALAGLAWVVWRSGRAGKEPRA